MKVLRAVSYLAVCLYTTLLGASTYTDWTEYPGDPVFIPAGVQYTPCVIYNANQFNGDGAAFLYKMWYVDSGSPSTLSIAYSNDGINWTFGSNLAISLVSKSATHPFVLYDPAGFGGTPIRYKMWFWSGNFGQSDPAEIQYSESADGVTWIPAVGITQDPLAPLFGGVEGATFNFGMGCVLYNPTPTSIPGQPYTFRYVMFYNTSAVDDPLLGVINIALAYSDDGIFWSRYGSGPILIPSGDFSQWDGRLNWFASVIKLADGYHMFYSGANVVDSSHFYNGIGHASSTDGLTWSRDADNPIFLFSDGVAWRSRSTWSPCVITNFADPAQGGILKMWFDGSNNEADNVGLATLQLPTPPPPPVIPNPPRHFRGEIKRIEERHHKNFVLHAHWKPSTSPNIGLYRIYENGEKVATVLASSKRKFKIYLHSKKHHVFTIRAVSTANVSSAPVRLKVEK